MAQVKKSQQEMAKRVRVGTVLIITGMLLLSACTQRAPERYFTTMELLIGLSDMPEGWQVSDGPDRAEDYISREDASGIVFIAQTSSPRQTASHRVYRYDSSAQAKRVYERLVLPTEEGESPPTWTYQSSLAEQSHFACYDYEGREPPVCTWSGRYEEYIVVFQTWLIPDRMSLTDVERIINVIDARMALYLGKTVEPTPGAE